MGTGTTEGTNSLSIVHTVSSLELGGMEQVVLRLAASQKQAGHRVGVMALHEGPLEGDLLKVGIRPEILGDGRVRRGIRAIKYFRDFGPDVVHAHNDSSLHYAVLAKLVTRAPVVFTVHGEIQARRATWLEWYLTSSVAIVSHASLRTLDAPWAAGKLTVIHNGIAPCLDGPNRDEARHKLGLPTTFIGIIVARLSGLKGHGTLLQSLRILRDAGVDLLVLVAGDGLLRGELEEQAAALSLDERTVRFLGARPDVDDLLCASDFFILPSDSEGLPLSVLEAMAHGLPTVASNVGGIPEIIEHGMHGLLVPPANPMALAAAIRRLVEDPALRRDLGETARARASSEFSLSTTIRNYDRLYQRAIAG